MIALIQRTKGVQVSIGGSLHASTGTGLLIFLGIEAEDSRLDSEWLINKIVNLRIFSDVNGLMNHSVLDVEGEIMVVSQFTLHASTKKGNRPSFIKAAKPEIAVPIYESFIADLELKMPGMVKSGVFGADMLVSLSNDGPVTIHIDSKNRV